MVNVGNNGDVAKLLNQRTSSIREYGYKNGGRLYPSKCVSGALDCGDNAIFHAFGTTLTACSSPAAAFGARCVEARGMAISAYCTKIMRLRAKIGRSLAPSPRWQ
ncbi:MAG: hypothetical protein NWR12_07910, partial [Haliea sp.]|nr:hypothetical protein [Haliea sp.]